MVVLLSGRLSSAQYRWGIHDDPQRSGRLCRDVQGHLAEPTRMLFITAGQGAQNEETPPQD